MPYLIDGHNLIPKVSGISLDEVEDEMRLVELLQVFCQRNRKQTEVFFDNAAPGGVRARHYGRVLARFVQQGTTADQAIYNRLKHLRGEARNWTVVSSDRAIQAAAHAVHAQVLSSEVFAAQLQRTPDESISDLGESADASIAPQEIEDWLKLFGSQDEED